MISVNFTSDVENVVATEHLYQWDNGQKLSISGVGTTADIHFANKKSEKALVVTPTVTSGVMVAPIPNSLLAEPYPIIAYVYIPSDDGAKTIKTLMIYVEPRTQPSDFVLEEDEGITTLETISQRANEVLQYATNHVNTAVSNMETDYTNFKNTIQGELDDMVANTTVPNADTLDKLHASSFAQNLGTWSSGSIKDLILNATASGFVFINSGVTDMPINGTYWFGFLDKNLSQRCLRITHLGADKNYTLVYNAGSKKWYGWKNNADGGSANTANTANTAGTLATTASNVCLRNISFGTAEPQVTDSSAEGYVAEGALYGQYE